MTEPKKYHCVSCLASARVGDDIRHELNCPNLDTAHNPDVSRVSYQTKTFTIQSTDPLVALSAVSMWECFECGALVDEQWRHTLWHTNEAKRFYELQRRTNRVRVKRPKGNAPTQGRVKPRSQSTSEESGTAQTPQATEGSTSSSPTSTEPSPGSKRRKVKKRAPKRETHTARSCNAAKDIGVRVGGEQHTCDCELPMDPEHRIHRCSVCKIGWDWGDEEWNPPDWTQPQGNVDSEVHGQIMHDSSGRIATLCNIESRDPTASVRLTDTLKYITCQNCIDEYQKQQAQNTPLPVMPEPVQTLPRSVLMECMNDIRKHDSKSGYDIVEVAISERMFETLLEDQGLRAQATAIQNSGSMGTIFGIPFVIEEALPDGTHWSIATKPRPGVTVVPTPTPSTGQAFVDTAEFTRIATSLRGVTG